MMNKYKYIYANNEDFVIEDGNTNDVIAYIVPNADKNSWRLVKVNEEASVYVNEMQVHLVHYLEFGDKIKVVGNDQIYLFKKNEKSDDEIVKSLSVLKCTIAAVLALIVVSTTYFLIKINKINPEDDIRKSEVMAYSPYVYKLIIKEIHYQEIHKTREGVIINTLDSIKFKDEIPSGTAFLCEDGKFVTARHCLEPWIATTNPDSAYKANDKCVRWTIDIEEFNFNNLRKKNDSVYRRLETKFILQNSISQYEISSDSAYYYMNNDLLINLGSPKNPRLWRSLGNYNMSSSLGDIVYIPSKFESNIKIAESSLIDSLNIDHPVAHLGYIAEQEQFDLERSRLSESISEFKCIRLKDTDVDKGFSGGPALVRYKGELRVIGVLSRKNDTKNRVCYCVPITMIEKSKQRWVE